MEFSYYYQSKTQPVRVKLSLCQDQQIISEIAKTTKTVES